MDTLDPEYEGDLLTYINEMKDDILKQMTYTEDLTNAVKGSRKTMLEIENGECTSTVVICYTCLY